MMKPRIPKPTSGHLDRSFFFVGVRGRIRLCLFAIVRKMKVVIAKVVAAACLRRSLDVEGFSGDLLSGRVDTSIERKYAAPQEGKG